MALALIASFSCYMKPPTLVGGCSFTLFFAINLLLHLYFFE